MDSSKSKPKMSTNPAPNSSKKPETTSKRLYLFDLNDNCLQNIFNRLDRDDLINIALVNGTIDPENRGRFAEIAGESFANKAIDNELFMVSYDGEHDLFGSDIECNTIDLLHSFGHLIKNLTIFYSSKWLENKFIDDALVKYCSGSLVSVKFRNIQVSTLYGIDKCFEKVQEVEFNTGLCYQINNFNKLFPNANTLIFHSARLDDIEHGKWIGKCFPAVKKICLRQTILDEIPFSTDHLKACISSNPQLEDLEIEIDYEKREGVIVDAAFIAFINRKLLNLKRLKLDLSEIDSSDKNNLKPGEQLCFEKLEELSISEYATDLPVITSKIMSKISADVWWLLENIDSKSKNRNVSTINVDVFFDDNETIEKFINLAMEMPKLKELNILCGDSVESATIVKILNASKQMKKLNIKILALKGHEETEKIIAGIFREISTGWIFSVQKYDCNVVLNFEK